MTRVFISRDLSDGSIIHSLKGAYHVTIDAFSLLSFEPAPFVLPECQWLFFYSPRAVRYFVQQKGIECLERYKVAVFGKGSAKTFMDLTGKTADLTGTGEKQGTAVKLVKMIGTHSVCFVSGTTTIGSIQQLAHGKLKYVDLAVYQNTIRPHLSLGSYRAAILTSPMNAVGFFQHSGRARDCFGLGSSTVRAIEEHGFTAIHLPGPTDEEIYTCLVNYLELQE